MRHTSLCYALAWVTATACTGGSQAGAPSAHSPANRANANVTAAASCPAATPQIHALVDHLDADYDPLHSDITPSVLALARLDLAGACAVLDRLTSATADTQMHAERVLEYVLDARSGF